VHFFQTKQNREDEIALSPLHDDEPTPEPLAINHHGYFAKIIF
jgi:hypothetical protein